VEGAVGPLVAAQGTSLLVRRLGAARHFARGTGRMPERVDQYRVNADKCLELAESFKDPDAKRTLFAMAAAWLTLAAQRVKNIETIGGSSTAGVNPAQPEDRD